MKYSALQSYGSHAGVYHLHFEFTFLEVTRRLLERMFALFGAV